jgi:hypothetical protein
MQASTEKIQYKDPVTIMFPGMVARVYSPILDAEERERRMKTIHRATMNIIKGVKNEKEKAQLEISP